MRDNNRRKNTLVTRSCLISGQQSLILRSQNQIWIFKWKIISFLKTTLLQREPFLTMSYTINSSPLLVYQVTFMLTNIHINIIVFIVLGFWRQQAELTVSWPGSGSDRNASDWERSQGRDLGGPSELSFSRLLDDHVGEDLWGTLKGKKIIVQFSLCPLHNNYQKHI